MATITSVREPGMVPINIASNIPNTTRINRRIDAYILEMICKMMVTDNRSIRRSQLINLEKFMNGLDPSTYNNDDRKRRLVNFIYKGLEARLQYNLTNVDLIMHHINDGIITDYDIIDMSTFNGINNSEIQWLNNMISEALKYSEVDNQIDNLMDICSRFKTRDYSSSVDIVKELEQSISTIQNGFRRVRNESHIDMMFNLSEGAFEDCVRDSYNQLANPKRKLITGMQGMNEMLGGGFEAGRCYVFFGLPGEGKSTLLLNLVYQLKLYNKDYQCKDPTKTPCIVLLTMENVVTETTERLFSVATNRMNMIDYDVVDVMGMMRTEGGLNLDKSSPINIIVKYMPTNSVDTSYLYTLTEDLEDMGYEVIAFFQDYIARIRSTQRYSETRIEYGAIVDEFKTFAELKDIPVITASQLNRDAAKHIDEGRKNNTNDLVRFLGRSNISESILILNNADAGLMLAPEVSQIGERYLGIQRIKIRYRASDMEYMYLPFVHNGIKLAEDFGMPPLYKTTLREEGFSCPNFQAKTSQYQTNAIYDMNSVAPSSIDDENIFKDATFISSDTSLNPALDALMNKHQSGLVYMHENSNRYYINEPIKANEELYCPITILPH